MAASDVGLLAAEGEEAEAGADGRARFLGGMAMCAVLRAFVGAETVFNAIRM